MLRVFSVIILAMFMAGCASGHMSGQSIRTMDPQAVLNKTWQWESTINPVEKIEVPDPERYTILLTVGGKVQARFDCNRGGGSYKISEGKLSFGPMMSTRMACPPDTLDAPFMKDLQRVTSFFIYLELPFDSGTMKFRNAAGQGKNPGTIPHQNFPKIHGSVSK
jgi:heat shock protein HslJ